jgi:hypothetical protein
MVAKRMLMIGTNKSVMFNKLNKPFDEFPLMLSTLTANTAKIKV